MPERYDRLRIHYVSSKGNTRACIEINGCSLIGLLSFRENRIKDLDDEAPAGSYHFLPPDVLYEGFMRTETENCFEKQNGIPLVTCSDCGEIHCWSVAAVVQRAGDCVFWTLRHNHRGWNYGLRFCFEKNIYDAEINGLRSHVISCKMNNK